MEMEKVIACALMLCIVSGGATDSPLVAEYVPVFTPGEMGYPCIRIPSILLGPGGVTLHAFAEVPHRNHQLNVLTLTIVVQELDR